MADNPRVVLETSLGSITLELFQDKAPLTVANFLQYVDDGHYDGTIFHRVISTFMIQGGGHDATGAQKPTRGKIKNESANGLANSRYTVAMARTSEPDSATSQFFINVVDNAFLDRVNAADRVGYCVFAKVVAGTDVVDKIKAVRTGRKFSFATDAPQENVAIISAKRA